MKTLSSIAIVVFFLLLAGLTISAQNDAPPPPPPPALAPDYNPTLWREYSFTDDNIRFRFPVEPKVKESVAGTEKLITHTYSRNVFMLFELTVVLYPADKDMESDKNMLERVVQGALDKANGRDDKVITQEDILVDGHPAKFLKVESNNGMVMRMKCFLVKNRMYVALAISKKGDRHGVNWENDFEVPAMAFLDSLHVTATK